MKLPHLWSFEGLLLVLTPASALAMPFVYGYLAPEGTLGGWVWGMPLVALFVTLIIAGALADHVKTTGRSFLLIRSVCAFIWLISTEAVIIAFVSFGVERVILVPAVLLMTFCWMPARLISAGIDGSRLEMVSALAAYALFVVSLF